MIRAAVAALPVLVAASLAALAQTTQPSPPAQAAPPAQKPAVEPTLLGQYGDWGAYTATPAGAKICFVIAKPKVSKTEPAGRKRDQAWLFVSSRPKENVKHEISVMIGYPFKTTSDATAEIGEAKYAMYTQNDGAWFKSAAEEARLVDAMRKASDITVKGTSGRGTASIDQFSLKGLPQALDKIDQECR
jgi:invasion protein IalB